LFGEAGLLLVQFSPNISLRDARHATSGDHLHFLSGYTISPAAKAMKPQWYRIREDAPGRLRVRRGPRWLAIVVLLGFMGSVALHLAHGGEFAAASDQARLDAIASHWGDEPCGSHHNGRSHDGICHGAGGCSFCVPVTPQFNLVSPENGLEQSGQRAVFSGATVFPHFHPPQVSARV